MKSLAFIFIFLPSAHGASLHWDEGLHLLAGGGANVSDYHRKGDLVGGGLHFKTDVAYSFKGKWSLETGSFVRFNYLRDTFIWDTLLTIGIRRRFRDNFLRVFGGRAPTVFFSDDSPEVYKRSETSRIIYTGPVYGLSWGKFLKSANGHKDLFWEVSAHYQSLEKGRGVKEGTVPEVVFVTGKEKIQIYSFSVTFGLLVF